MKSNKGTRARTNYGANNKRRFTQHLNNHQKASKEVWTDALNRVYTSEDVKKLKRGL